MREERFNGRFGKRIAVVLSAICISASGSAFADGGYASVGGALRLAQGSERQRGGASFVAGWYLADNFAIEGEAGLCEELPMLALRGLCNFRAWHEFDLLFGNERFDPFFTFGARGYVRGGGGTGPTAGLGARYYLDDRWAIRGDAEAMLALDGEVSMVYLLSVGLEFAF